MEVKVKYDNGLHCHLLEFFDLPIEILVAIDDKEMTIGEKRNWLYEGARGKYSIQVDDDDKLSPDFIPLVLPLCEAGDVDCITYKEECLINNVHYTSNHSIKYADWENKEDGFDYVRTPFFKDVIRTDIAKSVPVPHIRFGEDHQWSRLIKPYLKTEAHIDKELYYYIHQPSDHNERYGIKGNE